MKAISTSGEDVVKPDRSRYIWVYANSRAQKERWQALADKAKTPLSTWCISIIEERLSEEDGFQPRRKLIKDMETLKSENKALRDDLRQKEIVLAQYEMELRRYRAQPFIDTDFKGMRPYSEELVKILKARGHVDSYRLLEELGIDPRESNLVKAVTTQLEELEAYKLITTDGRSWKWMG
ncbi:MAG: hypothetical protein A4E48_02059 [Methanosaeta sp. PtaU1.Bin060]|nr:MAG: hypothetical protein A4E48_02059 [Methanosaeta sp. PtaU1.Bin060]